MAIDFEKFVSWCENRFGDVVVAGNEVKINSIFTEDYKRHLWCNPTGGKESREHGVYHCWKTDRKGTLVGLVMEVDKVSYDEALDILGGADITLAELEAQVNEMFTKKHAKVEIKPDLEFPPHTYRIYDLPLGNYWRSLACIYLKQRCISPDEFYVCTDGDYRCRVVIPYYDQDGKLIYWNARYLKKDDKVVRYMGPKKEVGIGKEDVVYIPRWPKPETKLYLTEGEFDAQAITETGLYAGALGGKNIGDKQVEIIRPFRPVLCTDCDKAGQSALMKIGEKLLQKGFPAIGFIRPPLGFKDWNDMLIKEGPDVLRAYLEQKEKPWTDKTGLEMKLKLIS
jgi:DNA primase